MSGIFWTRRNSVFRREEAVIYGPFPAMMERRSGRTRWYLLVQANERLGLHRQLDEWVPEIQKLPSARKVRWSIDVDPQDY